MTSPHAQLSQSAAIISLFGDVFAADFPDWIERHARKLGAQVTITALNDQLHIKAAGPDVMLEALALGCSLGPESVMVERMEFTLT